MSESKDLGALAIALTPAQKSLVSEVDSLREQYDHTIGSSWWLCSGGLALGITGLGFYSFQLYNVIKNPPNNGWVMLPSAFALSVIAVFAVSAVAEGFNKIKSAKVLKDALKEIEHSPEYKIVAQELGKSV